MALFSRIAERIQSHLSSRTLGKGRIGVRAVLACAVIVLSFYGFLALGDVLLPLALLLVVAGNFLDTAAVLSYASRPMLAVASYLTGQTTQILGGILLIISFFSQK